MKGLSIFGVLYAIANPEVLIWLVPIVIVLACGIAFATSMEEKESKRDDEHAEEFYEKYNALTEEQQAAFHVAMEDALRLARSDMSKDENWFPDSESLHQMKMFCFELAVDPEWVESAHDDVDTMLADLRRIKKQVRKA